MKKYINVQIGIYNTEITLKTQHRNGDVTLNVPFIKWSNNSGVLSFYKVRIKNNLYFIKQCFENNTAYIEGVSLWDYV